MTGEPHPLRTRVVLPTEEGLRLAAGALARGQPVGLPTETVYGLAAPAFDEAALARVFAAKERPTFDPLIVHVVLDDAPGADPARTPADRAGEDAAPRSPERGRDGAERATPEREGGGESAGGDPLEAVSRAGVIDLARLSPLARERATRLARAFWPGPLTLVLPRSSRIPDLCTAGLPGVGVRAPRHPAARALIALAGPLAAPSANRFGRISPTSAQDVVDELGGRIELVLDGGPCDVGVESTVVRVDPDGALTLLRPGGVAVDRLRDVAGVEPARALPPRPPGAALEGPGALDAHYAPATRLALLPRALLELGPDEVRALRAQVAGARVGLLAMRGDAADLRGRLQALGAREVVAVEVLSATGSLEEAARRLFAALRALDGAGAERLLAEPCLADVGLGHAIADRLRRAARGSTPA